MSDNRPLDAWLENEPEQGPPSESFQAGTLARDGHNGRTHQHLGAHLHGQLDANDSGIFEVDTKMPSISRSSTESLEEFSDLFDYRAYNKQPGSQPIASFAQPNHEPSQATSTSCATSSSRRDIGSPLTSFGYSQDATSDHVSRSRPRAFLSQNKATPREWGVGAPADPSNHPFLHNQPKDALLSPLGYSSQSSFSSSPAYSHPVKTSHNAQGASMPARKRLPMNYSPHRDPSSLEPPQDDSQMSLVQRRKLEQDSDVSNPTKRMKSEYVAELASFLRLACPYFKFDKQKRNWKAACTGLGWDSVHRLKEHLYRDHKVWLCAHCRAVFHSQESFVRHGKLPSHCPRGMGALGHTAEGLTEEMISHLKQRSRPRISEPQKWNECYAYLFDIKNPIEIPDCYYRYEDPEMYQEHLISTLPAQIRSFFESLPQTGNHTCQLEEYVRNLLLGNFTAWQSTYRATVKQEIERHEALTRARNITDTASEPAGPNRGSRALSIAGVDGRAIASDSGFDAQLPQSVEFVLPRSLQVVGEESEAEVLLEFSKVGAWAAGSP
ncbi:uncharacterized protein MKZ38_000836 [Zalerion maritima]|uniref:C2H2-type domain-containing protein n=1 Tax=Zalerion maritima TaxID=339359 RepID=A0AAD5WSB4_9PEZI|nr:uncharacterized protein MKZ38_000836 [Zalerion maritima]